MLSALKSCALRLLPLVSPSPSPSSTSEFLPNLDGAQVVDGVAPVAGSENVYVPSEAFPMQGIAIDPMITPAPKLRMLYKRVGNSLIGYYQVGSNYSPGYCPAGTFTTSGAYDFCCTATSCLAATACAGGSIYYAGSLYATCNPGYSCITNRWYPSIGASVGLVNPACGNVALVFYGVSPSPSVPSTTVTTATTTQRQTSIQTTSQTVVQTETRTANPPLAQPTTAQVTQTVVGAPPAATTVVQSTVQIVTDGSTTATMTVQTTRVLAPAPTGSSGSVALGVAGGGSNPAPTTSPTVEKSQNGTNAKLIGGAVGGGLGLLLLAGAGLLVCLRRGKQKKALDGHDSSSTATPSTGYGQTNTHYPPPTIPALPVQYSPPPVGNQQQTQYSPPQSQYGYGQQQYSPPPGQYSPPPPQQQGQYPQQPSWGTPSPPIGQTQQGYQYQSHPGMSELRGQTPRMEMRTSYTPMPEMGHNASMRPG